jgi:hypothetical protein
MKIRNEPIVGLEDGIWSPEYEGATFKIAYAGNVTFARVKDRIERPHRRNIEKNQVDPKDQRKWMIRALAEAILLDWKGVEDESGQPVPYSAKAGITALTNDESFREFVMNFSMELSNYRDADKEAEGNS